MRPLVLTLALLSSVLCTAQAPGLEFVTPFVEHAVNADREDVAAFAELVNTSDEAIEVVWIRQVNDLPRIWRSFICDTNQCHLPQVDSATFTLPAGASAPIVTHIYPGGIEGEGLVSIRVVNTADRSDNAVATFNFSKAKPKLSQGSGPRIYPNPGAEEFSIVSVEEISKVTLTNMLGKVVKEYPGYLDHFDVRDIPNGIYLASIFGADGRVVKTLRYSKRQVMP